MPNKIFITQLLTWFIGIHTLHPHHNTPRYDSIDYPVVQEYSPAFMKCFTIYNRQHEPIADAEFLLNGENLLYRSGYGYCIDDLPKPPYHLVIRRSGYLDAEYHNVRQLGGRLYLLREGEDYYYQQGTRVPIVRRRDLLVVVAASMDSSGQRIDAAAARQRIGKILAENGLNIITSYGDSLKKPGSPDDEYYDIHLKYSYLIARADHQPFADNAIELSMLRSRPEVEAAGPALLAAENIRVPMIYGYSIQVVTGAGLSEQEATERLNRVGYTNIQPFYSGNLRIYQVRLPAETGMSMNRHVERIAAIDGVIESEPEIILYQ